MTDIDALIEYAKGKELEFERNNPVRDRQWLMDKIEEALVLTLSSAIDNPLNSLFKIRAIKRYHNDPKFYGLVQQQLSSIMFLVDAYRRFAE